MQRKNESRVMDMTRGPILPHLLRFAWPVFIGCLCQRLYNFVDAFIVGKYLCDAALSAVSAAGIATYMLSSLALGVTTGASVVLSQYFGAGNEDGVRKSFVSSMYVALVSALVLTLAGLVTTDPLLRLLKTPADIFAATGDYLRVIYIGTLGMMLYNWIAAALRALGNSTVPLVFLIVSSLLNVALDLMLVAVLPLGVAGAAWATILSQLLSGLACLLYARRVSPLMRPGKGGWRYSPRHGREVLVFGLPTALQMSIISISDLTLLGVVNTYGSILTLAYGICSRIEGIGFQLGDALSMAAATFTGQNIGAGNIPRVKRGAWITLLINVAGYLLFALAIFLFAEPIMRMFTETPEAIAVGKEYLYLIAAFFVFLGVTCTMQSLLRAAGDVKVTVAIAIGEVVTRISLAFLLSAKFGYHGLWWVSPITWLVSASIGFIRYLSGRWIGKSVVSASGNK